MGLRNDIDAAIIELDRATERFVEATQKRRYASREEITAENAVNEAQKRLGALYDCPQREAPEGADWNRYRTQNAQK